ncbi:MAG TPA: response regulator transcription factor [Candidatus Wallbacteria bacterium]|nr:response regulator transcription factor [Candidatus Wallbacteria bacterium]
MPEKLINTKKLQPGMKLSKPLHSNGANIVLFTKDFVLDEASIQKAQAEGVGLVFIYSDSDPAYHSAKSDPAETADTQKNAPMPGASKILVVDDEEAIRGFIKAVLSKSGKYDVICVNDAANAWKILKCDPEIKIVFLDINMPEMNGLQLLQIIKTQLFHKAKIIMVTATRSKDEVVQAIKLGANDYVTKPFTAERLLKLLEPDSRSETMRQ